MKRFNRRKTAGGSLRPNWFTRQIEAHPVAWRLLVILLCILIVGFVEADDNNYFEQMRQYSKGALR